MNYTQSGAPAVGASMSLTRLASEAEHAQRNIPNLLLLTEEGRALLHSAARSVGYDPDAMSSEDWPEFINKEVMPIHHFLNGVIYAHLICEGFCS